MFCLLTCENICLHVLFSLLCLSMGPHVMSTCIAPSQSDPDFCLYFLTLPHLSLIIIGYWLIIQLCLLIVGHFDVSPLSVLRSLVSQ